jgi:hypothetical protein
MPMLLLKFLIFFKYKARRFFVEPRRVALMTNVKELYLTVTLGIHYTITQRGES